MKAAIYARKSTDDSDRIEDNKSVTRQIERAKAYAAAKGWTIDDDHIYIDDGISGANYEKRVSFKRLEDAARRGLFEALISSEPSRLGRSGIKDINRLVDILESGVRIFYYLDDKEETCDTFEGEASMFLNSLISKQERLRAAQRARDACSRKAEAGYNAGGRVYGYSNHQVLTTNGNGEQSRSHTEYRINKTEADVVCAIFRAYADGHGVKMIAKALNGDPKYAGLSKRYFDGRTLPSPRQGKRGTGSWAPSSVRAILHRIRYTGVIPYGKHKKVYRRDAKKRVKQKEFLLIPADHLRIVPDELWRAVRERHAAAEKTYIRDTNGHLWGRPGTGAESKYLLTGLAHCGCCTGNIVVLGRLSGSPRNRRKIFYYGCSYHNNRGSTVCANDTRVQMPIMDDAVLGAIETQVLNPSALAYVVEKALHLLAERRRTNPDRPRAIEAELKKLQRELANFNRAIAGGIAPKSVLAEIATREIRVEELERERNELGAEEPSELDLRRLRKAAEARIGRFKDLIHEDVPLARQALRKLFAKPLRFNPVVYNSRKTYRFEGHTQVGALIDPIYLEMASPRGVEPLLPP